MEVTAEQVTEVTIINFSYDKAMPGYDYLIEGKIKDKLSNFETTFTAHSPSSEYVSEFYFTVAVPRNGFYEFTVKGTRFNPSRPDRKETASCYFEVSTNWDEATKSIYLPLYGYSYQNR